MKYLIVFCIYILCFVCRVHGNVQSTVPILVGGLFETIGSSQNLHSLGEYNPVLDAWNNLDNDGVLSTGTTQAVALVESAESSLRGYVVGGVFNYLNHTSSSISFGNIAYYNQTSQNWQPLGGGCNGGITNIVVAPIVNGNCSSTSPCYSIIVSGHFDVCFQDDLSETTISFPGGFGFYDLSNNMWYKPINQSFPEVMDISSLTILNNRIYVTGNSFATDESTGRAFASLLTYQSGRVYSLNWENLAQTTNVLGRFNTIIPNSNSSFYIGGKFTTLVSNSSNHIEANNIVYYDTLTDSFTNLKGGTNGEVVTGTLVSEKFTDTLYIAGSFSKAGTADATCIASWDDRFWSGVGGGLVLGPDSSIFGSPELQLSSYESLVFIGGSISQLGLVPVNNIGVWNGTTWSTLGDDSPFEDYRMSPFTISQNGKLFVTAQGLQDPVFEDIIINGYPLVENLMASYNISSNMWNNITYNEFLVDGVVLAIEYLNDTTIVVGGGFRKVGDATNLNNIVLLVSDNQTSYWEDSFGGGVYGLVTSIQVLNNDIYVAGSFQFHGPNNLNFSAIAKFNSTGWSNLDNGIHISQVGSVANRPVVYDINLSLDKTILYVAGNFRQVIDVNGVPTNYSSLTGWDIVNEQWIPVQSGGSGTFVDIELSEDSLYIGGNFGFDASGVSNINLAKLKTNGTSIGTWETVPQICNSGLDDCTKQIILSVSVDPVPSSNVTLYIGGNIPTIQGNVMNGLARLVNNDWVSFGTGISGSLSLVLSLTISSDYTVLYVGGDFTSANSVPVNDIVAWDLKTLSFSTLASVEGWSGIIFDILPGIYNDSTTVTPAPGPYEPASEPADPLTIGVIVALGCIILCLILIIIVITLAAVRFSYSRSSNYKQIPTTPDSITLNVNESWDDFYSYEWEISYNLLEISDSVGRGRNGMVHVAMYKGQSVAVKIFSADISGTYYTKDNICKYASVMRSLKHPNIIHMIGACGDPLCLVTEYRELGSITDVIRISPSKLTLIRVKSIALDAARGMAYLHGQEPTITHQNLTSNNVILNEYWVAKISDPGLSGVLKESGEYKLSYSKRWTAPEVLLGRAYTAKSDIFSFGMILYNMLSHTLPYAIEERDTDVGLAQLVIRGVRPLIPSDREVPQQFIDIMNRCWEEQPDKRPTFQDILTLLNNIPDSLLEAQKPM